jgi:hypothetical protein
MCVNRAVVLGPRKPIKHGKSVGLSRHQIQQNQSSKVFMGGSENSIRNQEKLLAVKVVQGGYHVGCTWRQNELLASR